MTNTIKHKNGSTTIVSLANMNIKEKSPHKVNLLNVCYFVKVLVRKIDNKIIDYWPIESFSLSPNIQTMSYHDECVNELYYLDDLCDEFENGLRVVTAAMNILDTSGWTPNGWEYDTQEEPVWVNFYKPSLSEAKELVRAFVQEDEEIK